MPWTAEKSAVTVFFPGPLTVSYWAANEPPTTFGIPLSLINVIKG